MAKSLTITVTFNGDDYLIDEAIGAEGYLDINVIDALEATQEYCQEKIEVLEAQALEQEAQTNV
ncbi:hypothetical protein Lepto7376_3696 [[Leptolyngbya] sp. PCC 7376]|uniref:hypothetical protein n=1 Tax=[Leptolyngbya] sp. PCC 7376 TaxID=111781 RepID=UPI00029F05A5|nr:hypothetical protein [[Leptolyngbya] sp. PCC 7376]AFY39872.1 hypothetical protein Lepto7376_3696 [[Leptolyngbya] sp. PCC 7376]